MKENKVTTRAYKNAIEETLEKKGRDNLEYFSVREIEPRLGFEAIPASDELFEALEQLGLGYEATICPIDLLIHLEIPKITQELQKLSKLKISGFYYITHIDNLYSIFREGLLCKNLVKEKELQYSDISNSEVQSRRHNKKIGDSDIHSYVPLYVAHQNPMTYEVIREYGREDLSFICVNGRVLSRLGVYFSDGNAAADNTGFYKLADELELLDATIRKVYNLKNWGRDKPHNKRIRCAEVLVPSIVPVSMFERAIVYNKIALKKLGKEIDSTVEVIADMSFFP